MKVRAPVHDGTVGSTAMTPSILTACEQLMATGQLATHRGTDVTLAFSCGSVCGPGVTAVRASAGVWALSIRRSPRNAWV